MNEKAKEIALKVKDLFKKYGIKSVTMDDVSHELGISKKTLYEYFTDKSSLVRMVIDCETEIREKHFRETVNSSDSNAIRDMLRIYRFYQKVMKEHNPSFEYDLKKYYPDIFKELQQIKREKIMESVLSNLKKGKEEGLYRSDLDEEIIAKLYVLRIESLTDTDLFTLEERFLPGFWRQLFLYHLYGILSKKGYEYLEKNFDEIEV